MSRVYSWTRALWIAQLVVPAVLLSYALLRRHYAVALGPHWTAIAIVCGAWLLAGIAVLAAPAGRSWMRARARELLLALGSVAVVALIADVALSLTGIVPTFHDLYSNYSLHYRAGAFTLGRLEPNQVLEVPGGPRLEINSRGYRGPEPAIPKPSGTFRIVFLGGSQVFDQNGDNWPIRVGERLSTPERPVDVINAGIPSHRTVDSIGKLLTELWTWEPDVVVLCQAWNDIKYFTRLSPDATYAELYRPMPEDWRKEPSWIDQVLGASSFYRLARTRMYRITHGNEGEARRRDVARETPGEAPISARASGQRASRTFSEWAVRQYALDVEMICDIAASVGARAVLCTQPRLPTAASTADERAKISYDYVGMSHDEILEAFAICDRVIEEVASRKQAVFLDLSELLSGRSDLFADHIHFNEAGSAEAARVVADGLQTLLFADSGDVESGGDTP